MVGMQTYFNTKVKKMHLAKKKREECLAKANDLAARGRDKQARDYYVKCVDVTPQMAFQFIKVRSSGFLDPQEVVDV